MPFARPEQAFKSTLVRLAALYTAVFIASVIVLFAIVYTLTSRTLDEQVKGTVSTEIGALLDEYKAGGLEEVEEAIQSRRSVRTSIPLYYELRDSEGRTLASDFNAPVIGDGWVSVERRQLLVDEAKGVDSDEDDPVMGLVRTLEDGSEIFVGLDIFRIREAEEALLSAFLLAASAAVFFGAIGGVFVSFGFARRVERLNQTFDDVKAGQLSARAPVRKKGDEIDRLSAGLNAMLDRVEQLMDGMRQVTSDIAHDMRTPLSRLLRRLEGARDETGDIETFQEINDRAIEDVEEILQTFSALLRIAQIESGSSRRRLECLDLDEIVTDVAAAYAGAGQESAHAITCEVFGDSKIQGDRALLTQLVSNLIENAIRHSGPSAPIHISVKPANPENGVTLYVSDNGRGIPADQRENVLQRFYRLEQSRTTPGAGLGLALVKAISEFHGASIELLDNAPGLRVEIIFPEAS